MNEMLPSIAFVFLGVLIGGILVYLWDRKTTGALDRRLKEAEQNRDPGNDSWRLTVDLQPYVNRCGDSGWLRKKTLVRIGIQYQLFINGVPCLDPYVRIVSEYQESHINERRMEQLHELARSLVETATLKDAGGVANLLACFSGSKSEKVPARVRDCG